MKIKIPAVFVLVTCGFVDRSYTYWATEIDIKFLRWKLFHIASKWPVTGVEDLNHIFKPATDLYTGHILNN